MPGTPSAANWNFGLPEDEDDELDSDDFRAKESIYWCIEATPTMLAPMLGGAGDPSSGRATAPAPSATPTSSSTQAKPPPATQTNAITWQGRPARSKMEECLRCVYAMMRRKVISSPKDLIGVLVWNTVRPISPFGGVLEGKR